MSIDNINERLDFVERFDKLSLDGKKAFILFQRTSLSNYNFGEIEDQSNAEFGRFLRDVLKNQREMMKYKVQEWYLKLRDMELQYDPLTDYDRFKNDEKTLKDIIEQMGVWAGNEECINKQVDEIRGKI
ncbi:hypothetical protein LCGC14_0224630 [marine sediment metagenome]|uniref:Uncharacterized protein n=1 Tax=marine sediment metagenome TaxID=412755 RepID=A0A0F9UGV0_9ZZZZ|nr:hypothetical protein [bacterium]